MPNIVAVFTIAFFVNLIPKMMMAIFQVADDLRYLTQFAVKKMTQGEGKIPRSTFLNYIGAGLASATFGAFFYGVTKGKFNFQVENVKVLIDGLPKSFKGLRIVQISDAHLGSFVGSPQAVHDALQTVNDLKPDLILFTGDLVNSKASEAESWIDAFSKLEATMGKYSIMGNHDYAEYGDFAPGESEASIKRLHEIHSEMGFHLLLDEHVHLKRAKDRLVLAGAENWKGLDEDGHRKAPPLNGIGHTWHHDDKTLHNIIKYGLANLVDGYEGKMIGFKDNLSDKDIDSVLAYIKSYWPKDKYEHQINLSK